MGNKILDKIFIVLAGLLVVFAIAKIYSGYISSENAKNIEPSEQNLDIVIYAKTGCIYCMRAKELLKMKQLKYKQIELSNNKDLHLKLANQTGQTTVPYVFINNDFIGGFQELQNLENEGKL
ncbi:MAG: glutaredoxin domain-containing protein [Pseudomonadota bacterium]